ncbi:hypothetical protein B0H17DRAFT_1124874 [Mycena rosella]|uniref:Uncharacterized protein n=1 Tax=Mycena rosella TaxID=1033263 RepID=A0AAD7GYP1_MYCRO|nr:hypothetical protein B0H17DRAFT_1124874 [Mycena rosella]
MAPVPIGIVVPVVTSYGEGVPPHSFFMKYQVLFIILFWGLAYLAYMSVGPVFSMIKEWRKGEPVEDVEIRLFSHDGTSFLNSSRPGFAEMQERRSRLERDARYIGYVSRGKILSGKGRSFFRISPSLDGFTQWAIFSGIGKLVSVFGSRSRPPPPR